MFGSVVYFGTSSINDLENSINYSIEEIDLAENLLIKRLQNYLNESIIEQEKERDRDFLVSKLEAITKALESQEENQSSIILNQLRDIQALNFRVATLQDSFANLQRQVIQKGITLERIQRIISSKQLGELYLLLEGSNLSRFKLNADTTLIPVAANKVKGFAFNFSYVLNDAIKLMEGHTMLELRVSKIDGAGLERLFSYNIPLKGEQDEFINSLYHYSVEFKIGDELKFKDKSNYKITLEDLLNNIILSECFFYFH